MFKCYLLYISISFQGGLNVPLIAPLTDILIRFPRKLEVPLARLVGRRRSPDGPDRVAAAAASSPVARGEQAEAGHSAGTSCRVSGSDVSQQIYKRPFPKTIRG